MTSTPRRSLRCALSLVEPLEDRIAPAFTGVYSGAAGSQKLTLSGDATDAVNGAAFSVQGAALLVDDAADQSFSLEGVTTIEIVGGASGSPIKIFSGVATATRTVSFNGGGADLLTFESSGATTVNFPDNAGAGSFVDGGGTYTYARVVQGAQFVGSSALTIRTPGGPTSLLLNDRVLSSVFSTQVRFDNIGALTLDLGAGDTAANGSDSLSLASLPQANVVSLTVLLGEGTDTLGALNPLTSAGSLTSITLDGGSGTGDGLIFAIDGKAALSDQALTLQAGGATVTFGLGGFEFMQLRGGDSDDTFNVTGWTGAGSVSGSNGVDTIVAADDVDYQLDDNSLSRGGAGRLNLSSIEVATLTGGVKANIFSISNYTGVANLDGGGGANTLSVSGNAALIKLSDTQLQQTGVGLITHAKFGTVNLTGGTSDNTFDVSTYTGAGTISGATGSDTLLATNDVIGFSLSNTQFGRTNRPTLTISSIEVALLTGSEAANYFTLSGFTGSGTISGGGGSDTIGVQDSVAEFRLSDTQLARTGYGTLTLTGLEVATIVGGTGNNTFRLDGWTGGGSFNGIGGIDQVILDGGAQTLVPSGSSSATVGQFILSNVEQVDGGAGRDALVTEFSLTDRLRFDGVGAFTTRGISYTNMEVLQPGGSNNVMTLPNLTGVITITGLRSGNVLGVDFTNFVALESSGSYPIVLPDMNLTFTYTGNRSGIGAGISFTQITTVTGGTGGNTLENNSTESYAVATGTVGSVKFTNFADITTAGLLLTSASDDITLSATGSADFQGLHFRGLTSLDGLAGADTLNLAADVDFVLNGNAITYGARTVTLTSLETTKLTGGTSDNTFTVLNANRQVFFDGGAGNDKLVINSAVGVSLAGNQLIVGEGKYTLGSIESLQVPNSTTFTYTGEGAVTALLVEPLGGATLGGLLTINPGTAAARALTYGGELVVSQAGSLLVETPAGNDLIGVNREPYVISDYLEVRMSGVGTDPFGKQLVRFRGVADVMLDLAAKDTTDVGDQLVIFSLAAAGLERVHLKTGIGNDRLQFLSYGQIAFGTDNPLRQEVTFDGGAGMDTFTMQADISFGLSNTEVAFEDNTDAHSLGKVQFQNGSVEAVSLAGGEGANHYLVNRWSGSLTFNGMAGNDIFDLSGGATGPLAWLIGGEGDDTFIVQSGHAHAVTGLTADWQLLDGGEGFDTVVADGDLDFRLTQNSLVRSAQPTKASPALQTNSSLGGIEHAVLTGGASRNLLDAGLFPGTSDLAGGGSVDKLIASQKGGSLYGYAREAATPTELKSKLYTRDNFYAPDGTVQATLSITATKTAYNAISFRYYQGIQEGGIKYHLTGRTGSDTQIVSGEGSPKLTVALTAASGALLATEGSSYDDRLSSTAKSSLLFGLRGVDVLQTTGGGLLVGGGGSDRLFGPAAAQKVQGGRLQLPGTSTELRPAFLPTTTAAASVSEIIARFAAAVA